MPREFAPVRLRSERKQVGAMHEESAWQYFANMQASIGKASRLTSPGTLQALEHFYSSMQALDRALVDMIAKDASEKEWLDFYDKMSTGYGMELREVMRKLASDYSLMQTR